ncbi:hypothetical protein H4R27_003660 [Coemansia aciculifera]|nr:hypothetical protein H4R27_003660 [Coemansia aciculifera]
MTQLSIKGLTLNSEHENMSHIELHDHFTSKWCPLSPYLQYCGIDSEYDIEDMATCAMLLVAICPRVTRFMANMQLSELVQDVINQAIKEEPFNRYADRLKCLTYNGIPEGSKTFAAKQTYW